MEMHWFDHRSHVVNEEKNTIAIMNLQQQVNEIYTLQGEFRNRVWSLMQSALHDQKVRWSNLTDLYLVNFTRHRIDRYLCAAAPSIVLGGTARCQNIGPNPPGP